VLRLKIKELAEEKGINQGKLSRLADVGYSTIRRIFDDPYTSINFSTLERIARALGVPAKDLIEEIADKQESGGE